MHDLQPSETLETKVYKASSGSQSLYDDVHTTYAEFKEANDESEAEFEKKNHIDVVLQEKIDRLSHAIDVQQHRLNELALKASRPGLGGSRPGMSEVREDKIAFEQYMRKGVEMKALEASPGSEGGFVAPLGTEGKIKALLQQCPCPLKLSH